MNQIKPYQVWIGHCGDARSANNVAQEGIRAVVQLAAEEPPEPLARDLIYCRYPLFDGTGNDDDLLDLAIRSVADLIERGVPTLVTCGVGVSRAPAIVAAALSLVHRSSLEDCLTEIVASHKADVSPGLWKEVRRRAAAIGRP
jgi:protein-tyrosine phosphatase